MWSTSVNRFVMFSFYWNYRKRKKLFTQTWKDHFFWRKNNRRFFSVADVWNLHNQGEVDPLVELVGSGQDDEDDDDGDVDDDDIDGDGDDDDVDDDESRTNDGDDDDDGGDD